MTIKPKHVERYLRDHGYPNAELVALVPLGADLQEGLKQHGYGRPLRARFVDGGEAKDVVLRTMTPDRFGHDRRADRMDGMILAYDGFELLPHHIRPLDLGVVTAEGTLCSIADGEPFLLTEFAEGELYARDLSELARLDSARERDVSRARALARYLAEIHGRSVSSIKYQRAIRDLIGHGEGIMGLVDAYQADDPVATPDRLRAFEHEAVDWRWRLRGKGARARRTHGDFHPFNILFAEGADFVLLDASRGVAGDPADDVTALSINYIFFALSETGRFTGALRQLWDVFWECYLEASKDSEVLSVVAPFFAWRALVLGCPAWYPNLAPEKRDIVLGFAERLLAGADFTPDGVDALLFPGGS